MSTQNTEPGPAGVGASTLGGLSRTGAPESASAITVLVSTAIHPLSGRPCTSRNDTLALEIARGLSGGALRALHVGDPQDAALADYLALGAPSVEVLPATPGSDIVAALAEQVSRAKLVLCGTRSQSGESSGMLPYLLGAALKRPVLAEVLEVQLLGDTVKATQFLPKGRRRTVTVSLPAIIAVHPLAAAVPHYAYARRVAGRIETLPSLAHASTAPSGVSTNASSIASPAPHPSPWTLESVDRVPVKLKAPDRRSGHARMLAATVAASRGGQVVNEGSDVEKAQAVLAYLREHDLIAF
jgi:electron transfer flavoprotein beta subunit